MLSRALLNESLNNAMHFVVYDRHKYKGVKMTSEYLSDNYR